METREIDTLVLGAGLTGLSCALHLERDYLVLEREDHVGGLTHTNQVEGHSFDITGHWLHLRKPRIKTLVADLLGSELAIRQRRARVFSHGVYTPYPYQANTHGLPPEVAAECLMGFVKARCWDRLSEEAPPPQATPETFADFILQRMGEGIAKHFMFPYNEKLWTVHPREMDASWCERFVPVPSLEDVIMGAFGQSPQGLGYNVHFLYPRAGGIARLPQAMAERLSAPVELGVAATALDLERHVVETSDGRAIHYRHLVSSAPLNQLLQMAKQLPDEIRDAAQHLTHTTLTYFDVAARGANPDQPHWSYVPEADKPFYRVGSFSAVEPGMAPPKERNFYVEYSHQGAELPLANAEDEVVDQLCRMRLIDEPEDILFIRRRTIQVAYVLMGAAVEPARRSVLDFLDSKGVISTGRYGAWVYAAMEDALFDGIKAAKEIAHRREA